jgi:hypothetical protein
LRDDLSITHQRRALAMLGIVGRVNDHLQAKLARLILGGGVDARAPPLTMTVSAGSTRT